MERPVSLVPQDPLESQVPLDHQEREAHLELQDLRGDKERREPRESLGWKVPKERPVPLVLKDHLESLDLKASGVSLAQLESKAYQVPQALTDPLDLWALLVYPV